MPTLSLIIGLSILALTILTLLSLLFHQLLTRRRRHNHTLSASEDTIRLTLSGPRSTSQLEYMKGVRSRNLFIAWEEAMRIRQARGRRRRLESCDEEEDGETDLSSVGSGAMVLSGPTGSTSQYQQFLAPPIPPWMKRSPTMGSSVYSGDSAKSKTPTVVEEWELEHGGFSPVFGMEKPVGTERWV